MSLRLTDISAYLAGLIARIKVRMIFCITSLTAYFAELRAGIRINMRNLSSLAALIAIFIIMPVIHVTDYHPYKSTSLAIKVKAGSKFVGRTLALTGA
jgi:hypothetical protein